jgi:hypothetical protein
MPLNIGFDIREIYGEQDEAFDELAVLLHLPPDKRNALMSQLDGYNGDTSTSEFWWLNKRGDIAAFGRAELHARGLLRELQGMSAADFGLLSEVWNDWRQGGPPYLSAPLDGRAVLKALGETLAFLAGRHCQDPARTGNWVLAGFLNYMREWPQLYGTLEIRDHRSKTLAKALSLLHILVPNMVPERISPNTIKTIWKPRPKKGRKPKPGPF